MPNSRMANAGLSGLQRRPCRIIRIAALCPHGHWTAPAHRCGRDLSGRFGSDAYAVEELVADLGAAFLCAELGITVEPRPEHAQYLAHWLTVPKADKRAIFTAASKAAAAVAFLHDARP